ncbi:MAG: SDR family oxidoreductase [Pseudohongiellaceae bacterium]
MTDQDNYSISSLFGVRGKSALITGGSSGIGLMIARGLLLNGVKVTIASRKQEKCDRALTELTPLGNCDAMVADVTDAQQRHHLVEELTSRTGDAGLDILINNAGANWGAEIEDYPDSGFDKVMKTNVNAVFSLTRDLLPLLQQGASPEDPARVVNIGSMDGIQVPVVQRVPTFAYSASKAALHHLTRTLAVDLAHRNITVNAVAPGFFESRMTDFVLSNFRDDIEADCPLGRIGQPEEMIGIVTYLVSRAGTYTTGTVIPVDGGTHLGKGVRKA